MFCCGCVVVLAMFLQPVRVQVYEGRDRAVEICARKNLQSIYSVKLHLIAQNGNATGNCLHIVYRKRTNFHGHSISWVKFLS